MKKIIQVILIVISAVVSVCAAQVIIRQLYQHRKGKYVDLRWDLPRNPWEK